MILSIKEQKEKAIFQCPHCKKMLEIINNLSDKDTEKFEDTIVMCENCGHTLFKSWCNVLRTTEGDNYNKNKLKIRQYLNSDLTTFEKKCICLMLTIGIEIYTLIHLRDFYIKENNAEYVEQCDAQILHFFKQTPYMSLLLNDEELNQEDLEECIFAFKTLGEIYIRRKEYKSVIKMLNKYKHFKSNYPYQDVKTIIKKFKKNVK